MKFAIALGIASLAVASLPAAAADLSARIPTKAPAMMAPSFTWTGCYLGGYVGGAFANRAASATDTNGYNGPDTWSYNLSPSPIGGGTLGCNYQTGQFVFGLEGEGGYMSLRGSALDPLSPFLPLDTTSSTTVGDWYAMATGRAGIAWDRALLYVKGGAAFVNTKVSVVDPILQPVIGNTINAAATQLVTTWTIGGGLEYALGGNWTIKGEYMYIALNQTQNACGAATIGGGRFCWSETIPGVHTVKIGLNYLFNAGPVVARY
jgi:outer membrane immunogenic protein